MGEGGGAQPPSPPSLRAHLTFAQTGGQNLATTPLETPRPDPRPLQTPSRQPATCKMFGIPPASRWLADFRSGPLRATPSLYTVAKVVRAGVTAVGSRSPHAVFRSCFEASFGLALRRYAGKQKGLGSNLLRR